MYYGWRVVAGVFVAQLFVVGFYTYASSLLVLPVQAEFGVSRVEVMYGFTFSTLVGLVLTPAAGAMLDRYPARWLVSGGALAMAAGLWWLANSRNIWEFVLVFGLSFSVANSFAGSMSASTAISRWFSANRGKALGISALGTSVGGMLVPLLLGQSIASIGWRAALEFVALATLLLMVPVVLALVRGKPADVGLQGEGGAAGAAADPVGAQSTAQILRNPGYWYLGLSLGILFCVYSAMMANLGPYAQHLGHDAGMASLLITVIAVAGFVGKLVFGALADRMSLKLGLWAAQALVLAGFLLLALEPAYMLIVAAAVCIGFAAGGMLPVWGALMAQVFGLLSYGRAMGLMGPLITLSVMPGYGVVGAMFDASGGYATALLLFCGLLLVSALLLIPLQLPQAAQSR